MGKGAHRQSDKFRFDGRTQGIVEGIRSLLLMFRGDSDAGREADAQLPRFSPATQVFIFLVIVAGATELRLVMAPVVTGLPYIFYFPAVVIVTVLLGGWWGMAALFVSAALARYLFIAPVFGFRIENERVALSLGLFLLAGAFGAAFPLLLRRALDRIQQTEARLRDLIAISSGVVWTTDRSGAIKFPQAAWHELTGDAWPRYRGRNWMDAVWPEDRAQLSSMWTRQDVHPAPLEIRMRTGENKEWRWFAVRATAISSSTENVAEWVHAAVDIHERKVAQEILVGEMGHRLKNLMAVIDAIARQSFDLRRPTIESQAAEKFLGRIRALLNTGEIVLASPQRQAEISAVLKSILAPFGADKFTTTGAPLLMEEATSGSIALAIHELATNSAKYGALSKAEGRVSIKWSTTRANNGQLVEIEWKESDGPLVIPPSHEGYGSRVIRHAATREKEGVVKLDYEPDGLRCRISFLAFSSPTLAVVDADEVTKRAMLMPSESDATTDFAP